MMRRFGLVLCLGLGLFTHSALAQSEEGYTWQNDLQGTIGLGQVMHYNWQKGGLNSLSYTLNLKGKFVGTSTDFKHTHTFNLLFGQTKQGDDEIRNAEDEIEYTYTVQYTKAGQFNPNPTFSFSFRTQFAEGFKYRKSGAEKVADFFSPAQFVQGLGFTYEPNRQLKTRLSISTKQTIVDIQRLRPRYFGEDAKLNNPLKFEFGIESMTEFEREIFENVDLTSSLNLFFAPLSNEKKPDILWKNLIRMHVNSWLNVRLEAMFLLDVDSTPGIQARQTLNIGFTYQFLK